MTVPYDLLINICTGVMLVGGGLIILALFAFAIGACIPARREASDLDGIGGEG